MVPATDVTGVIDVEETSGSISHVVAEKKNEAISTGRNETKQSFILLRSMEQPPGPNEFWRPPSPPFYPPLNGKEREEQQIASLEGFYNALRRDEPFDPDEVIAVGEVPDIISGTSLARLPSSINALILKERAEMEGGPGLFQHNLPILPSLKHINMAHDAIHRSKVKPRILATRRKQRLDKDIDDFERHLAARRKAKRKTHIDRHLEQNEKDAHTRGDKYWK